MNDAQRIPDAPPLWRQLQACAAVVLAVQQGRSGTVALEAVDVRHRAGVQALAFHVWRHWGRAEALREKLARRAPPQQADSLLCCALALAQTAPGEAAAYDMHTLVDQAVDAAKRQGALRAQASFINACLRRYVREADALLASTANEPQALWNHPPWWIRRLQQDYPVDWQMPLQVAQHRAPMTLRVNLRQCTRADYLQRMQAAGLDASIAADVAAGVVLHSPVPVQRLPGFAQGMVSVQDAAAQHAAPLLLQGMEARPRLRVLDACAAPGGKTGHLLELAPQADVLALDVDAQRAQRIHDNLERLRMKASVRVADAANPADWWDGQSFDAILLDAPCSASGIVRRHPDIRWLRRETDIDSLGAIQQRMLQTLWPLLAPGGRLLYCTCSVFRAEGHEPVQTFLAHNKGARLLPSPGHLLPCSGPNGRSLSDNPVRDHDGFFYALLEKPLC